MRKTAECVRFDLRDQLEVSRDHLMMAFKPKLMSLCAARCSPRRSQPTLVTSFPRRCHWVRGREILGCSRCCGPLQRFHPARNHLVPQYSSWRSLTLLDRHIDIFKSFTSRQSLDLPLLTLVACGDNLAPCHFLTRLAITSFPLRVP